MCIRDRVLSNTGKISSSVLAFCPTAFNTLKSFVIAESISSWYLFILAPLYPPIDLWKYDVGELSLKVDTIWFHTLKYDGSFRIYESAAVGVKDLLNTVCFWKLSELRYLLSTVQRSARIRIPIIAMAYSLRSFSYMNARITPAESRMNTRDLKVSFSSSCFLSVTRALLSQSGDWFSYGLRNEPANPGISIIEISTPPVIAVAVVNALRKSFLGVSDLKRSLRASTPRRGIQNCEITRIKVTDLNLS